MKLLLLAGLLTGDTTQSCDPILYTPDWDGTGHPLVPEMWPHEVLPIEQWEIIGPYDSPDWLINILPIESRK